MMLFCKRRCRFEFEKRNKKSPHLSIKKFAQIQDIFTRKGWPIEDIFDDDVFDNFCEMLASLKPEQCDLIISLTEKFLWVQESEYVKYFSNVFHSFITSFEFLRGKKFTFAHSFLKKTLENQRALFIYFTQLNRT